MTRSLLRSVGHLAFATSMFFVAANAANAACYPSGQEMPADQVNAFLKDPAVLLANSPTAGEGLIAKVRDLIASNPDTLEPVLSLLKDANAEQKTGIGNGLNQAAAVCLLTDQAFATEIQRQLATTGDQEALLAYTMASGGTVTAATGGAGAGGGGVGGPTTPPSTTAGGVSEDTPGPNVSTNTSPTNLFTGDVGGTAVLPTSAF
jgi:hypothetical protein